MKIFSFPAAFDRVEDMIMMLGRRYQEFKAADVVALDGCLNSFVNTLLNARKEVTNIVTRGGRCVSFFWNKKRFVDFSAVVADGYDSSIDSVSYQIDHWLAKVKKFFPFIREKSILLTEVAGDILRFSGCLDHLWRPTPSEKGRFIRESIYGGRAEVNVWKGHFNKILNYDVVGAYMWASQCDLPCGTPRYCTDRPTDGIYLVDALVEIPNKHLGLLPTKSVKHGTYYPADCEVRGWYWSNEVEVAEHFGAKVKKVYSSLAFKPYDALGEVSKKIEELRFTSNYPKSAKQLINLLVGMTAVKNETTFITEHPISTQGASIIPGTDQFSVTIRHASELPVARPQVFSYIASMVRSFLQIPIQSIEPENILSFHTDGIIVTKEVPFLETSKRWKRKEEFNNAEWFAPWNGAYRVMSEKKDFAKGPWIGENLLPQKEEKIIVPKIGEHEVEETKIKVKRVNAPSFRNRKILDEGRTHAHTHSHQRI